MKVKDMPIVFSHKIYLVKAGERTEYSELLARGMETPCVSVNNLQSSTSYLGSVFQLQKGDSLYVKVYRKEHIKPVVHMNFFGAHMI